MCYWEFLIPLCAGSYHSFYVVIHRGAVAIIALAFLGDQLVVVELIGSFEDGEYSTHFVAISKSVQGINAKRNRSRED